LSNQPFLRVDVGLFGDTDIDAQTRPSWFGVFRETFAREIAEVTNAIGFPAQVSKRDRLIALKTPFGGGYCRSEGANGVAYKKRSKRHSAFDILLDLVEWCSFWTVLTATREIPDRRIR